MTTRYTIFYLAWLQVSLYAAQDCNLPDLTYKKVTRNLPTDDHERLHLSIPSLRLFQYALLIRPLYLPSKSL